MQGMKMFLIEGSATRVGRLADLKFSSSSSTHVRVVEGRTSTLKVMSGSTSTAISSWSPQSWRQKPVVQDVVYPTPSISSSSSGNAEQDSQPDPVTYKRKQQLEDVVSKLEKLPPIVSPTEVTSHTSSHVKEGLGRLTLSRTGSRRPYTDRTPQGKAWGCRARAGILAARR